jgi:hypothetical protein
MNRFIRLILVFVGTFLLGAIAHSATIPNTEHPTTFVGPTIRAGFTNRLVETMAYSLLGEAGPKNYRIGGTYAWKLSECQRLKLSIEYLWQDITYAFFSGNTDSWMNQYSASMAYQYDFTDGAPMHPQLDINAYGSHAASKVLGNIQGTFIDSQGSLIGFTDARRIAGSTTGGISPGISISPWYGSRISAALNYDRVHYDTKYLLENENSAGFGGTVGIKQMVTDYFGLGATAAVRQPFNYYDVNLIFSRVPFLGAWTVGVFGAYISGKNSLPNTYNAGITADYFLDQSKDDVCRPCKQPLTDKMLTFASRPAVYMPQVLAIPE